MLAAYSDGGTNFSNWLIAGERKGSSPSQSMHRNLRPGTSFTSMSFMGARHFGQIRFSR
jgi:hypothetical protein